MVARDSSVNMATRYWLDIPGIESRWRARFYAPVQTGPGGHAVSYRRVPGLVPGGKSGRGVALTTYPHITPRLEEKWVFMTCSMADVTCYERQCCAWDISNSA
jgi:hypothetical protein